MSYLIDSDWVADYLKGRQDAIALLSSLRQDGLAISLVTYGEIYEGLYYGRDPKASERGFLQLLRRIEVLPITRTVFRRFAQLRGQLRQQGRIIGDFDLLIAATALTHGYTLVTRNRRHFDRVPDLVLYQEQ